MHTNPPSPVAAVFGEVPPLPRKRMMQMRALIYAAADATETGPLSETLKWGQPAYLTEATKTGTTIRLGWTPSQPDICRLFVHCQTDLVSRFRQIFPTEFTYEKNRAVLVPASGDFPRAALQQIAAMALSYHRDKRAA